MPKTLIAALSLVMAIMSCKGPEKLLNDVSADRLYFGKSGGFTNIPLNYVIINYSQIYRIEDGNYNHVVRLNRSDAKKIKYQVWDLDFDNLDLNEPGNITYYFRLMRDGREKEIKWCDQSQNTGVKDLYNVLLSSVKQK